MRRALLAAVTAVCLTLPALGQTVGGDYLDVFMVKVKPEKQADFDVVARKIADANRKGGDRWICFEPVYGDGTTVEFVSSRGSYGDVDKAMGVFMGAMNKAFGADGMQKTFNQFNADISGSRTELRKRRWDLSRKAPKSAAEYAKAVGEARVVRTTAVHVKPGHGPDFEALLKDINSAAEQNAKSLPVWVSQVVEGNRGTTYYVSTLRPGMAGFDDVPSLHEIIGDEAYKKYLQGVSDWIEGADSNIFRFSPSESSPAPEVAAVAPDFWNPKPMPAAKSAKQKAPADTTKQ